MKVLLIEDSEPLRRGLKVGLDHLGYTIDETGDGAHGLSMALTNQYDVIILDLMLPSVDGISILKSIRQLGNQAKVIILSAKSQPEDRVNGLLSGADDYLGKPFSFDELHARLVALTRRGQLNQINANLTVAEFELDSNKKSVFYQGQAIELTKNEYKILEYLFSNQEQVLNPEQISEAVVGSFDSLSKNTIEAHLSSIRKKAKLLGGTLPVKNKRGFGYYVGDC
ncbi:transcriptional regulator [Shewanella denitrificans OS217]|jgi:DNA-binding response OmpR family regulator|uniref:Transcriptional regulator n=1 Tax=Shewanella denitrificans (strain OS217 / ATCC BAA-1090 / DSM 15013) TaxID=318161 RepID=Q12R36_SHEDO|nr:response regulator transcription factor [Shewanella denitrificans]ABE54090.1 transcriptional regulator [Shewanella denitrificans OS217]